VAVVIRAMAATHTFALALAAVAATPAGAVRSALPAKLAADSYTTTSSRHASAFKTPITATHTFGLALAAVAASAGDGGGGSVGPFGGGGGGGHQGVGDRDIEVKEGGGRW